MIIRFFGPSLGHVRKIGAWWRKNRPSAPALFADELEQALERLAFAPEIGPLYLPKAAQGVRRLLLPKTQYYVYYAIDRDLGLIGVIAVWSCRRGSAPRLAFFKGLR
jgi:plasmid stabilization system protein ParE